MEETFKGNRIYHSVSSTHGSSGVSLILRNKDNFIIGMFLEYNISEGKKKFIQL